MRKDNEAVGEPIRRPSPPRMIPRARSTARGHVIAVLPHHAITRAALREVIKADKLLRKAQGALSIGVLDSKTFENVARLVRQGLADLNQQTAALRKKYLGIPEQSGGVPFSIIDSGPVHETQRRPGTVRITTNHPISRAIVQGMKALDVILHRALVQFSLGKMNAEQFDELCGRRTSTESHQGEAERAVEVFALQVERACGLVPTHVLQHKQGDPPRHTVRRFRDPLRPTGA